MAKQKKRPVLNRNCATSHCRRRRARTGRLCNTCKSRAYRLSNPIKYSYDTLRTNTIRRKGIAWFYLTFAEFSEFCYETKYLQGVGRSRLSWSIDRIDNTMGYFIGNIRKVTIAANSSKHTKVLNYDYETGRAYVSKNTPPPY